ncbi:3-oxoacyl-ACP synthase III family protein [Paenibacillus sinopodophylli]|uniref:3-oxoacyl-ACP synthase III family protein n=1 Tax=Paenibacillus sinopodophylli TaxID=1837342 RepID=UPI001FEC5063|nr:ketoacyl-ACP synthase III [Paenibacillus sinopodophylli]
MKSYIKAIEYYLPDQKEYNDPEDKMTKKIGITVKNIAAENEYASDLAINAANKIFKSGACQASEIDFLIYCTQSPDYYLPTTACILQDKLGLSTSCGALDINLGCSGYVYGLSLAKGLIEAGMAKNIMFITSDTYSKYINPKDRNVKLLFGDAAAATLISGDDEINESMIGPFIFGTDGKGAEHLIVPAGGLREPITPESYEETLDNVGNSRSRANLYMNGNEIFNFAVIQVPKAVQELCDRNHMVLDDFNYFVFHQANQYMLETLRRKMDIPREKFSIQFADCGNTVSSTIPIALIRDFKEGKVKNGDKVLLVGFGVGLSWGVCSITMKIN